MEEGEDFEGESEDRVSTFNSAGLINLRINELLQDVNRHKRTAEFSKWNADLDAFWCELAADTKEGDEEDLKKAEFDKKLSVVAPIVNWGMYSYGFKGLTREQEVLKYKQYLLLTEKELFLRRLMSKQGKGTKFREAAEDYMTI